LTVPLVPRALRVSEVSEIIATLSNIILKFGCVPECFQEGRTILIHKGGELSNIKNNRPITIFPLVRRVIEKCLDKQLRGFTETSKHQRCFKPGPGTRVNASILNGCLNNAKINKEGICIVYLQ